LSLLSTVLSAETGVNTTTFGDQGSQPTSGQGGGTIAVQDDGTYAIVWQTDTGGVFMQRFDASGAKLGAEARLSSLAVNAGDPAITSLAGGGYAVTWQQSGASGQSIAVEILDGSGAAVSQVQANTHVGTEKLNPSIAGLAGGGFVVVWESANQATAGYDVYSQRFDASGNKLGGETLVNVTTLYDQASPVVAATVDGGYTIAWLSASGTGLSVAADVMFKPYKADGDPVYASGPEFQANIDSQPFYAHGVDAAALSIGALVGGGFVLAWAGLNDTPSGMNSLGIWAIRYNDGWWSNDFQVNTYTTDQQTNPAVAGLANGGFIISWQSAGQDTQFGDAPGTGVYAQRYDFFGQTDGFETRINTRTTSYESGPSVASFNDGSYVLAWTSIGQDANGSLGVYQRIATVSDSFALTDGADAFAGGASDTLVTATQGSMSSGDDITGGSGVDVLRLTIAGTLDLTAPTTFSGFEAILGTAGDDTFIVSADRLAGVTFLMGGSGRDTISYAGQPAVVVDINAAQFETIEDVIGSSFDDVIAATADANHLYGGAGADVLDGSAGDDYLDGGAGADTLIGGYQDDVFIVDNSSDVVIELSGEGTDTVRTAIGDRLNYANFFILTANVENLTGTSAGAQGVQANGLDNVVTMGIGADLIAMHDGGVDTVNGGQGSDYIYFGAAFTAADHVDGGAHTDTLTLMGATSVVLTAASLVNVERLVLYSAVYAGGGAFSYQIETVDETVAAGATLFVTAASLQWNESLIWFGAAEADGHFTIHGGAGVDYLLGGDQSDYLIGNAGDDDLIGRGGGDTLIGGAGSDAFVYGFWIDSTAASPDQIVGYQQIDVIQLSAIDANTTNGAGDDAFTFIDSQAFHGVAGELRVYQQNGGWVVAGDVDGDGVADLMILIQGDQPLVGGFWL
jgi:Ca2+-binding RTX toxin-like protein